MTVQNNHFTPQLQNIARPAATEKASPRSPSAPAATAPATADNAAVAQTAASPVGLVGNHVNTTA